MTAIQDIDRTITELVQKNSHLSLNEQMAVIKNYFINEVFPAQTAADIRQALDELCRSGITDRILKNGDQAPPFALPNVKGETVSLSQTLLRGPAVVVFYRGAWCPYCNLHLNALEKALPKITGAGGSLLAISPQTIDNSISLAQRNNLTFEVLSDSHNLVARAFGLVYQLSPTIIKLYDSFGISLLEFNGDESYELPVSGTFVIGQNKQIAWAYAEVDYTKRAEPEDIISALEQL
jgi:peroxiredoxin